MKAMGPIPTEFDGDGRGWLSVGGKSYQDIIGEGSTPVFAYDLGILRRRIEQFRAAMPGEVGLHYAVKANPWQPLLAAIAPLVDGFDLASLRELRAVDIACADTPDLPRSFAGPGKTDEDLRTGLAGGITFHVESEGEFERVARLGESAGRQPRLAVRVNPPFGLKGSGMKMGGLASQFGVDHEHVPALVRRIVEAGAEWRGCMSMRARSRCRPRR